MLLVLYFSGHTVAAQQPISRFLRTHYKAADGTWVRRPRIYKRGPRTEQPTATAVTDLLASPTRVQGSAATTAGFIRNESWTGLVLGHCGVSPQRG